MITPINNIQTNTNFKGLKFKMPKKFSPTNKPTFINNTQSKLSNFFDKTKNEFKNMDNETKDLLFNCIILSSMLAGVIGVVAYHVNLLVEKIQNLFP